MKPTLQFSIAILIFFFTISCQKNKPVAGEYVGVFTYTAPQGFVKTAYIEISNPTKNSININGSVLEKDGKKIEGKISDLSFSQFGVTINGEWSHKLFSKAYKITGSFTETYYQGGNEYENSGTFEIKSN